MMVKIKVELGKMIKLYMLLLVMIPCIMLGMRIFFIGNILPGLKGDFISNAVEGFFIGFNISLMILLFIKIMKIKIAIKNDEMMKKYYTFMNDERSVLIKTKSGIPLNIVNAYVIVLASHLFQGINIYISVTCLIIAVLMIFQMIILKFYYMKTM